jgi:hypothetical protein
LRAQGEIFAIKVAALTSCPPIRALITASALTADGL